MNFRTEITVAPAPWKIGHRLRGLAAGSCFADSMAARLRRLKFGIVSNPTGVLYNPVSLEKMLRILVRGKVYRAGDLQQAGGRCFSYDFHGSFAGEDTEKVLGRMNAAVQAGRTALQRADYVLITLGTGGVYRLAATDEPVANCHRQPGDRFIHRMLSLEEVIAALDAMMRLLGNRRVIWTLSPVRYLKYGFEAASLDKAVLRVAIDAVCRRYPGAYYFPSYEILQDDLRDYRFYAPDLVHPSSVAVDYIWEKFACAYFDPQTVELCSRLEKLAAAVEHRLAEPDSQESRLFLQRMYAATSALQETYPELDLTEELAYFGR